VRKSHRRHSASPRRKVEWGHFDVRSEGGPLNLFDGDIITAWAKWPSGFVDTNFVELPTEEKDDTLVRAMWWPYLIQTAIPASVTFFHLGLIAWDTSNPADFDRQVINAGEAPDPFFGGYDWILRKDYIMAGDSTGADFSFFYPTVDFDMQSRAMRKLPVGTGILFCLSVHTPEVPNQGSLQFAFGVSGRLAWKSK